MKAEVNKASSMYGYAVKAKHAENMTNFLASKNFELRTNMNKEEVPVKGKSPRERSSRKQVDKRASATSTDSEAHKAKIFILKENIEKDIDDLGG